MRRTDTKVAQRELQDLNNKIQRLVERVRGGTIAAGMLSLC
jgi:hypothetical protein